MINKISNCNSLMNSPAGMKRASFVTCDDQYLKDVEARRQRYAIRTLMQPMMTLIPTILIYHYCLQLSLPFRSSWRFKSLFARRAFAQL